MTDITKVAVPEYDDKTGRVQFKVHPEIWNVYWAEILLAKFAELELCLKNNLGRLFVYQGSVDTYDDLPTDADIGDVWNVEDTGANYCWTGTEWDKLSETYDFSIFLTKEEAASTYETKEEHAEDLADVREEINESLKDYVEDEPAKDAFEKALEW